MARSEAECHTATQPELCDPLWRRRISQQIGNSGEIGLGFDPGAENGGKLAPIILIGARTADDNGTDDCRLPFVPPVSALLVPDAIQPVAV